VALKKRPNSAVRPATAARPAAARRFRNAVKESLLTNKSGRRLNRPPSHNLIGPFYFQCRDIRS